PDTSPFRDGAGKSGTPKTGAEGAGSSVDDASKATSSGAGVLAAIEELAERKLAEILAMKERLAGSPVRADALRDGPADEGREVIAQLINEKKAAEHKAAQLASEKEAAEQRALRAEREVLAQRSTVQQQQQQQQQQEQQHQQQEHQQQQQLQPQQQQHQQQMPQQHQHQQQQHLPHQQLQQQQQQQQQQHQQMPHQQQHQQPLQQHGEPDAPTAPLPASTPLSDTVKHRLPNELPRNVHGVSALREKAAKPQNPSCFPYQSTPPTGHDTEQQIHTFESFGNMANYTPPPACHRLPPHALSGQGGQPWGSSLGSAWSAIGVRKAPATPSNPANSLQTTTATFIVLNVLREVLQARGELSLCAHRVAFNPFCKLENLATVLKMINYSVFVFTHAYFPDFPLPSEDNDTPRAQAVTRDATWAALVNNVPFRIKPVTRINDVVVLCKAVVPGGSPGTAADPNCGPDTKYFIIFHTAVDTAVRALKHVSSQFPWFHLHCLLDFEERIFDHLIEDVVSMSP
ncbi:hypothetical protein DIPPA_33358, partial [Diplonema papillatum]